MNIKEYETIKPIISFYLIGNKIYFIYKETIIELNDHNLNILKEELTIPYKIEFKNISINLVVGIIEKLKTDESDLFAYRIKNPITNNINYYAILNEKQKVKQIK